MPVREDDADAPERPAAGLARADEAEVLAHRQARRRAPDADLSKQRLWRVCVLTARTNWPKASKASYRFKV